MRVEEIPPVDDFFGEIGKSFELLRRTSKLVTQASKSNSFPIVLSGNCMASVGVAAGLKTDDLGCVWFDAHDDYNTPDTMMSGYLDSTGVSMMAGESFKALMDTVPGHRPFDLRRFVFCGIRDVTDVERRRVEDSPMKAVWGNTDTRVNFASELGTVLDQESSGSCMVHLDLDALDISYGRVNQFSAAGGLFEGDLQSCLGVIAAKMLPLSLTVASYDPNLDGGDKIADIAVNAIRTLLQLLVERKLLEA